MTITGGTPPYTIAWSNEATTEDISNVAAGYYAVRVNDSDPLTEPAHAEITLTEPEALRLEISLYEYPNGHNISLFAACNGIATITAYGGVNPITFLWNDGSTNQNRSNLCARNYGVTATDANGCEVSSEKIYITQPPESNWSRTGNANTNSTTDFIGTTDNQDLVIKSNGIERARVKANGDFNINRIVTNRIVSKDTIVQFGDSTITMYPNEQRIFGGTAGSFKGMAIGVQTACAGLHSTAIGYKVSSQYENSVTLGYRLTALADNAFIIGTGTGSINMNNYLINSIMMGCNSNLPTLVITGANGTGTTGSVGIGTSTISTGVALEINGKTKTSSLQLTSGAFTGYVLQTDVDGNASWVNANTLNVTGDDLGNHTATTNVQLSDNWLSNDGGSNEGIRINDDGEIGIAIAPQSGYKLVVDGKVGFREAYVKLSGAWPDYVFKKDYKLFSLEELSNFIKEKGHLPNMPAAKEIEANGQPVGKIQLLQQEKIEEMVLYILDMEKRIKLLEQEKEKLKSK